MLEFDISFATLIHWLCNAWTSQSLEPAFQGSLPLLPFTITTKSPFSKPRIAWEVTLIP